MTRRDTGPDTIGVIGGTGPQGRGLAVRLALAGHPVVVGSRDATKADDAARGLRERAGEIPVRGAGNEVAAADAAVVIVAVPYEAQASTLPPLADAIGDKLVVNCVNPLAFDAQGPHPVPVADGSAAQECARLLPRARVVSAFSNVSATKLLRVDERLPVDVLICGDDDDAKQQVRALAERIPGMRGVDAGPLRLARVVEDLTAVLLAVNRRYGVHSGVRIDGLDEST